MVAAPLDVPGGEVRAEAVRVHVPEEVAAHRRADEPVRLLAGLGRRAAQDTVHVVLLVNLARIEISFVCNCFLPHSLNIKEVVLEVVCGAGENVDGGGHEAACPNLNNIFVVD